MPLLPPEMEGFPEEPRVLVVDDDGISLATFELLLEPLGAQVVCAGSGERALAEMERGEFAVVVLDVSMPGLDGFETAELIRRRPEGKRVPIIFVTGEIDEGYVRRGYALGAADYVLKPFDPEILRTKVGVFVDLARLRRETEVLTKRTLHDPLTGLPNRVLLLDRVERALAGLQREGGSVALLFLDLDEFKTVNDTLGHDAGDKLLVATAARLRAAIRAADTAARYGGDEFVILCDGLAGAELAALIDRVETALTEPIQLGDRNLRVGATVGAASTNDPSTTAHELICSADEDMLERKRIALRARPRSRT